MCLILVTDWLKSLHTLFPRPKLAADWKEISKTRRDCSPVGLDFRTPAIQ
uniref:Uncharacterized protein n=1 Tax=Anguilla anguilla TaxID=7936 RepID=A0A0E9QMR3_ANGAN